MPVTGTVAVNCWKCAAPAGASALVCTRCEAVQPLLPGADLFSVLGLPRRLSVDTAELERRYLAASRAVHPDRHQTATPRERELSLAASAAVNRAYRTLKDPVARGRYWLELNGARLGDEGPHVPPEIAAEVFETQEKLAELRSAGNGAESDTLRREVEAIRATFARRLDALRDGLLACYAGGNGNGAGVPLDELKRRLSEIAYLRTLLGDIEDTMGEGFRGTDRRH
jgi:molecular chaperone HscB